MLHIYQSSTSTTTIPVNNTGIQFKCSRGGGVQEVESRASIYSLHLEEEESWYAFNTYSVAAVFL